ncbi:cytochrome c oxidase assembly protein [Nonomuraea thailandensis]
MIGLVLLSGVGGYARAMLSMQALQLTVLAVAAPLLLCLGAPLTLLARATGRSSRDGAPGSRLPVWWPALLPVAYLIAFPLLYRTGWLQWALFRHVPHLLTGALFLAGGLVVFWMLAGVDPLPRPISRSVRVALLGSVVMVQLAMSVFLLLGTPVAEDWFSVVAPPGAPDLRTDQRLAGVVFLLAAAFTLVPLARRAPAAPG